MVKKHAIIIIMIGLGVFLSVSYDKLWKLLMDKKMNETQLKDAARISTNAVAKLSKNETVSLDTLYKICCALNCDVGDILHFQ